MTLEACFTAEYSDDFNKWADDYFTPERLNTPLTRQETYNFFAASIRTKSKQNYLSQSSFMVLLKEWVKHRGFKFFHWEFSIRPRIGMQPFDGEIYLLFISTKVEA